MKNSRCTALVFDSRGAFSASLLIVLILMCFAAVAKPTAKAAAVSPSDYGDQKSFVNAYVAQKMASRTAAEKDSDKKRLGGESLRKSKFRREAVKIWDDAKPAAQPESKDAAASAPAAFSSASKAPPKPAAESAAKTPEPADESWEEDLGEYLAGLPLESLFGVRLGDVVEPDESQRVGESSTYSFAPAKKFRKYEKYVYSITPVTHRVYGIRALGMNMKVEATEEGVIDMRDEWVKTKTALEKKFEKKAMEDIGSMICPDFKLLFPGADGKVAREIQVDFGTSITAVDLALKAQAEEERQQAQRKKLEESVSEDVDAL